MRKILVTADTCGNKIGNLKLSASIVAFISSRIELRGVLAGTARCNDMERERERENGRLRKASGGVEKM